MDARRTPSGIASLLDRCLDRVAGEPGASAIWRRWEEAVGPQVARRAQPVRLRGHTLVVAVSSTPWMQELQLLKPTIRTELNARLPSPLVDDLYFVLTEGAGSTARVPLPTRPAPRCPQPPAAPDLHDLPEALHASFGALLARWHGRARRQTAGHRDR